MKPKINIFTLALVVLVAVFITQGCVKKKDTVQLIPSPKTPIACQDAYVSDLSDHELAQTLDRAVFENQMECWKQLVEQALEANRDIPKSHLARAVNAFNKNKTQDAFSLATHRYFVEIANGNGQYKVKDKMLMKAWLGFEIKRAQTKKDQRLIRAKRVCQRLDNHLYRKFFL